MAAPNPYHRKLMPNIHLKLLTRNEAAQGLIEIQVKGDGNQSDGLFIPMHHHSDHEEIFDVSQGTLIIEYQNKAEQRIGPNQRHIVKRGTPFKLSSPPGGNLLVFADSCPREEVLHLRWNDMLRMTEAGDFDYSNRNAREGFARAQGLVRHAFTATSSVSIPYLGTAKWLVAHLLYAMPTGKDAQSLGAYFQLKEHGELWFAPPSTSHGPGCLCRQHPLAFEHDHNSQTTRMIQRSTQ